MAWGSTVQPIYILHYKKNIERKNYLDSIFNQSSLVPQYITNFDREEIDMSEVYRFDRAAYDLMIDTIRNLLISNFLCLTKYPQAPWAECYRAVKRLGLTRDDAYAQCPWLQPRPLKPAAVSVFLKHRAAWEKIAISHAEWGIVAEDDIIFRPRSEAYLCELLSKLPSNFDYIDIAGGCGMLPRAGNLASGIFYRMDPPSTRTACCAIIARKFAARLVTPGPPNCVLPIDWALNAFFDRLAAEVYWVEPTVFEHGSETKAYQSWARGSAEV
jgi:hypothetical protein